MSTSDESASNGAEPVPVATWQSFTYLGVSSLSEKAPDSMRGGIALADAQVGDRLHVVALNCGESNRRLRGMGLMAGCELQVMSRTASGSVIVSIRDRQLGFAAEVASHIQVRLIDGRPASASATSLSHEATTMPTTQIKLRDAAIGARLRVSGYEPTDRTYKHKLLAMGLTPGTEFTVTRHAPLGDPTEITVRGYQLSLRKREADALQVEAVHSGGSDA